MRSAVGSVVYVVSLATFGAAVFLGIPFLLILLAAVLAVGWVAAFGLVTGTLSLVAGMLLREPAAFRGSVFLLGVGAVAFMALTLLGGAWHAVRDRSVRRRVSRPMRITLRQGSDAAFFDDAEEKAR